MADYRAFLIQLHSSLNTLREREAKWGGNSPLELLSQIADHQMAIALTEQAIAGALTEAEWREVLQPLLIAIRTRTGEAAVNRNIDTDGGVYVEGTVNTTGGDFVGRDQVKQTATGSYSAQASPDSTASININPIDQSGQQVSGGQYNAAGDINIIPISEHNPELKKGQFETYAVAQVQGHGRTPFQLQKAYLLKAGVMGGVPEEFATKRIKLPNQDIVQIDITIQAENMDVEPSLLQTFNYYRDNPSDLLKFHLTPRETGHKQIRVEFYYQQHWLAQIKFEVEVIADSEAVPA